MYLGLDLGTSSLKGVIIDTTGEVLAVGSQAITLQRPQPGWSEQNPADWLMAAEAVLHALHAYLPSVKSIGLSGQMHGATCLDSQGKVIRPAILWNDTRAFVEADWLDQQPITHKITGNLVFPGFTAPKLLWLKNNEPEHFARLAKVLLPKDYLRYWLTGHFISDKSDAAGTAWLDMQNRQWSETMLSLCDLSKAQMPDLVESCQSCATIKTDIAAKFGFQPSVQVAGGAGDNAATAMGLQVEKPGDVFLSLGTSGVVFAVNDAYRPLPESALHTFCYTSPQMWHQMGVTLSATDCLNWLANTLNEEVSVLVDSVRHSRPGKVLFLPFLAGERTPYNDPDLRVTMTQIAHQTKRHDLVRAALEGVIFSLKESIDLMVKTGTLLENCYLVGGGSRSDIWAQLTADILQTPIIRPCQSEHAAAVGAARLGALSVNEDFPLAGSGGQQFTPRTELADFYADKYQAYLRCIKNIKAS